MQLHSYCAILDVGNLRGDVAIKTNLVIYLLNLSDSVHTGGKSW